ncbi:hypothetical protein P4B35_17625 [Pontiellaceae bacterium B12227]|nr:hypothetical protein [Pontiellaceae bacterium B12227]
MWRTLSLVFALLFFPAENIAEVNIERGAAWYEKGINYVKRGDLVRANRSFANALFHNPEHPYAQEGFDVTLQRLEANRGKNPRIQNPRRNSIRVSFGSTPGIDNASETEGVSEDGGMQFEVLYVKTRWGENHPNVGFLYGGGLFLAYNKGVEVTGESYDAFAIGFMGELGVAARVNKNVIVELSPYLGLGALLPSIHYGVKGGVHVVSGRVGVGLEVGYGRFEYSGSTGGSGARVALAGSFNF